MSLQNKVTKILTVRSKCGSEFSATVFALLCFGSRISFECHLLAGQPTRIHFALIPHQTDSGLQWEREERLMGK